MNNHVSFGTVIVAVTVTCGLLFGAMAIAQRVAAQNGYRQCVAAGWNVDQCDRTYFAR